MTASEMLLLAHHATRENIVSKMFSVFS